MHEGRAKSELSAKTLITGERNSHHRCERSALPSLRPSNAMTGSDLRKLLRQGESENLEFKESFDREAVEAAGAFANAHGGVILVGVSGKHKPTGVELGKGTVNDWANQISSATDPRVIPDIEVLKTKLVQMGVLMAEGTGRALHYRLKVMKR